RQVDERHPDHDSGRDLCHVRPSPSAKAAAAGLRPAGGSKAFRFSRQPFWKALRKRSMRLPFSPQRRPLMKISELLDGFGLAPSSQGDAVRSPVDGSIIGHVRFDDPPSIEAKVEHATQAFRIWREVPAPRRGELVRLLGEELRANKQALGRLVTIEAGKIVEEGLGEVQEMIDICDFAVGLS